MFIKVTDEAIANTLIVMGFQYMKECVNNKCTYVFEQTPELLQQLMSCYERQKPIIEDRLRF